MWPLNCRTRLCNNNDDYDSFRVVALSPFVIFLIVLWHHFVTNRSFDWNNATSCTVVFSQINVRQLFIRSASDGANSLQLLQSYSFREPIDLPVCTEGGNLLQYSFIRPQAKTLQILSRWTQRSSASYMICNALRAAHKRSQKKSTECAVNRSVSVRTYASGHIIFHQSYVHYSDLMN